MALIILTIMKTVVVISDVIVYRHYCTDDLSFSINQGNLYATNRHILIMREMVLPLTVVKKRRVHESHF